MEFHENRPRQPFIGFMLLWRAWKAWRARARARQVLSRMSDEQLRDVGLRRDDMR
ncbi:DUF1127 domain-containing protein [Cronobacter dublinensis subsp. dublinensis]|nr:DUF1127 domain-containing protein [Cronobacter dublinensis subsp. dublinensis]EGT5668036.1 DUF1127 domain-containing protein [Cronobacter dublinensis subsp. dublinensis]EGT5674890.1 DUF1127 domain-containing protein [Cronobacter dublinensis subsp. dublinensis]EGT5678526.1 DUF1127 domain-containing protein [Cronobacter dublinensis subsp. dublinensis]EGT5687297.1 DUF1127 domain-containing protein [Cronobacter dublinensis subsp. dublinensis]